VLAAWAWRALGPDIDWEFADFDVDAIAVGALAGWASGQLLEPGWWLPGAVAGGVVIHLAGDKLFGGRSPLRVGGTVERVVVWALTMALPVVVPWWVTSAMRNVVMMSRTRNWPLVSMIEPRTVPAATRAVATQPFVALLASALTIRPVSHGVTAPMRMGSHHTGSVMRVSGSMMVLLVRVGTRRRSRAA
jgi:hypothetical protein